MSTFIPWVDPLEYHNAIEKLRAFFVKEKGFIEVPTQSRLSILAACEDPTTIGTFQFEGNNFPLPQTGQMTLEMELLNNPSVPGYFCQSTSYRNEANPIPGRHNRIFQMFEFEAKGNFQDLINMEKDLLDFLGFEKPYKIDTYKNTLKTLGLSEDMDISASCEERIWKEISPVYFLTDFTEKSNPFFNMKRNLDANTANKCDVILYGIETIGSAEREIDPDIMLQRFHSISDGQYANILYAQFGRARVMHELGTFLDMDFFPRFGGGMGMNRVIRALKMLNNNKI